jgi:transcriptional regulator with XRE-family HTH domain
LGCNDLQQIFIDCCCNLIQVLSMTTTTMVESAEAETTINVCVKFGKFIKTLRLSRNATARDVASAAEMLPSNFSKIEHGVLRPPQDASKQRLLAAALGIAAGSPDEEAFFDLAAAAVGGVPADIADIISREEALPLLLRTIGNKRLGKEDIEKLVALVRGLNGNTQAT